MSKRVVLTMFIFLVLVIFIGGIGLAQDQVELNFMHRWTRSPDNEFLAGVAKEFESENPDIKINVTAISNNPFKEKIKIILGTDNAPDVFFSWPGEFTNRFIREDRIMDLSQYMSTGWQDSFVPSILEPFKYQTKIYGAPYRMDAKVFVYNKEIFNQLVLEKPTTFADLLTVSKKIKAAGITPIAFGNQDPWAVSHYIGQLNAYNVPYDVYQKDLDPAHGVFTNPGYLKALQQYQSLTPYFNSNPNAITHNQARANFLNDEAAMMYIEIVEIPEIMRERENLSFQDKFDIFKMPFPTGAAGNPDYLVGYPEGFVISAATKHPAESVRFLKYLTSRKVGKMEAKKTGFINGSRDVLIQGEVNDAIYNSSQLVLETEKLVNWFDSSLHSEVWSTARVELQKLTDGLTTPAKAMEKIQKTASSVRADFE